MSAAGRLSAADRRRQLVAVALDLFAERGFNATTMDDIAERAGVTKPLLYQHFASKRALYLELVDGVSHDMVEAIATSAAAASGPRQQVEAGFAAYFQFVATSTTAFRRIFGSDIPDDPELSGALRRVEAAAVDAVDVLIDAGLEPEHRRLLAQAVMGMAEAASRYWLASTDDSDFDDHQARVAQATVMARRLADMAWAGLRSVHRD